MYDSSSKYISQQLPSDLKAVTPILIYTVEPHLMDTPQ